ncbi:unnamed protein product [Rhizoctonia solani]|uniref:F-box domain-containing protein n=1 Tax=Rhizoctonia solani TaxID=456999 RepID=A0A8H3GIF1_9AGAM|nr:unnamed protein product [Rhizoctonia solani]
MGHFGPGKFPGVTLVSLFRVPIITCAKPPEEVRLLDNNIKHSINTPKNHVGLSHTMWPRSPPRKVPRCEPPTQDGIPSNLPHLVKTLIDLPLDILIEIAAWLQPLDMIQLSRVNKDIRGLLMRRSAACMWRTSLCNVGALPPVSTDLTGAQLAVLLFSGECTQCGEYTDNGIDFIFRARLCSACRQVHLMVPTDLDHSELLFVSEYTPSFQWTPTYTCLRSDYLHVKSKYEELRAAGDTQALDHWAEERRKAVESRCRNSLTLTKWFSALVGGPHENYRHRQQARRVTLNEHVLEIRNRLQPIYCIRHTPDSEEFLNSLFKDAGSSELKAANVGLPKDSVILPSFPCVEDIFDMYPGLRFITASLTLGETFESQLKDRSDHIQQTICTWRNQLEQKLLNLLPEGTQPAELENFDYTLVYGTGEDVRPMSSLRLEHTSLLRADAVFGLKIFGAHYRSQDLFYYPDDFRGRSGVKALTRSFYNSSAAKVAQALLRTIGSPDISYQALSAAPKLYQCGRCYDKPILTSWKEMLQHYLHESYRYQLARGRNSNTNTSIQYIFMHDPDLSISCASSGSGQDNNRFFCLLCIELNILDNKFLGEASTRYHIQNVHLVNELIEGVHYTLCSSLSLIPWRHS